MLIATLIRLVSGWLLASAPVPYTFPGTMMTVNAFATMGGVSVYINTGLVEVARNEVELASVLAHEIGHIASRHFGGADAETATALPLQLALIGNTVQIGADSAPTASPTGDEFEADRRGLQILGRVGYAQSGMISYAKSYRLPLASYVFEYPSGDELAHRRPQACAIDFKGRIR